MANEEKNSKNPNKDTNLSVNQELTDSTFYKKRTSLTEQKVKTNCVNQNFCFSIRKKKSKSFKSQNLKDANGVRINLYSSNIEQNDQNSIGQRRVSDKRKNMTKNPNNASYDMDKSNLRKTYNNESSALVISHREKSKSTYRICSERESSENSKTSKNLHESPPVFITRSKNSHKPYKNNDNKELKNSYDQTQSSNSKKIFNWLKYEKHEDKNKTSTNQMHKISNSSINQSTLSSNFFQNEKNKVNKNISTKHYLQQNLNSKNIVSDHILTSIVCKNMSEVKPEND